METERLVIDGDQVFHACCDTLKVLRRDGVYEPAVTGFVKNYLDRDMVFVDAGAHLGYYTLLAARRAAWVHAFEPHAGFRAVLLRNLQENGHRNVDVLESALFSRCSSGSVDGPGEVLRLGPGGPVGTTTLDDYLGGDPVHLVKVDVEGAEYDVLLGAEQTLRRHGPALVVEVHAGLMAKCFDRNANELLNFLAKLGYEVISLTDRKGRATGDLGGNRHLIARKD
jgi:FkbM family methyltransferase